jgi:spoIIIJ-associated protein
MKPVILKNNRLPSTAMESPILNDETQKTIKKIVADLVEKMGIVCQVEENKGTGEEESLILNIKTEESNYLIGQYGVNLQALQHIARVLTRKKIGEKISFMLDVNFYRQEKNESISILAKNMAEQALTEKRAIVMRPMSPFERRLVHMELAQDNRIKTESIGEGEDRRVVIKPADLI